MGGFLEKPITEKVTQIEEGNGLKTCAVAMQGWRSSMEVKDNIIKRMHIYYTQK